jgi:hypothetical protein
MLNCTVVTQPAAAAAEGQQQHVNDASTCSTAPWSPSLQQQQQHVNDATCEQQLPRDGKPLPPSAAPVATDAPSDNSMWLTVHHTLHTAQPYFVSCCILSINFKLPLLAPTSQWPA